MLSSCFESIKTVMEDLTGLYQTLKYSLELSRLQQLGSWSYALLLVMVALEGPVATLFGAVAAAAGWLNPILVFLAATTGNLMADIFWYLLGFFGKTEWLVRYGRRLRLSQEQVARLEKDMHDNAPRLLLLTKLTSSMAIPTLVAAGLARVEWRRWFSVVFLAECARTGLFVLLGYNFGAAIYRLEDGLQLIALAGAMLMVLLVSWYFWRQKRSSVA